ncbi:hypothetical protein E2C01_027460 [Portunus trituberculatus]|uniref:Uncharacterized protein n=1 Tax=Portunus trituberculatus TaxID=210409 RepID=A0A5B7ENS7_PORTR|nr:hypothetical protein [Portunus trituberculatus]
MSHRALHTSLPKATSRPMCPSRGPPRSLIPRLGSHALDTFFYKTAVGSSWFTRRHEAGRGTKVKAAQPSQGLLLREEEKAPPAH